MDTAQPSDNFERDLAILNWLVELGADEAICEQSTDRYALTQEAPSFAVTQAAAPAVAARKDTGQTKASHPATTCHDLESLRQAVENFDGCALKQGARKTVFSDGNPLARLMVIGEAPGREEDQIGKPFVGAAGQLLDRMLAAIGLSRDAENPADAVYLTNILPWRPPQNRDPTPEEIAVLKPFVLRHIALVKPDFLLLLGNISTRTLLDTSKGITKMRGQWQQVSETPALPMLHPAYLLRMPAKKRETWMDLLSLKSKMTKAN